MNKQRSTHGTSSIGRYAWLIAAFAIVFLTSFTLAVAQDGTQAGKKPDPQAKAVQKKKPISKKTAPGAGGVTVFIDPVTGEIREPDTGELDKLGKLEAKRQKQSVKSLNAPAPATMTTTALSSPSGAVGMKLGEDQMSYSVVRKNPDGTLSMECVTGSKAAADRVKSGTKRDAAPQRKETLDEK